MMGKIPLGRRNVLLLSLLALVLIGIPAAEALLSSSTTVHSTGSVKAIGVGVFQNSGCTQTLTSVDWGTLEPGTIKNVTIYVKNQGNAPVTLSLQTGNWNPTGASSYLTLGWNYGGASLAVNEVKAVVLSLTISSSITGITSFSFDITIAATG
jgi:hypothetical protein